MGPPAGGTGKHTETRYYVDPKGNISQQKVAVENRTVPQPSGPDYRYYRQPDGSVVRQKVTSAPRPGGAAPGQVTPRPPTSQRPPQRAGPPRQAPPRTYSHEPRWTTKRIAKHIFVILVIVILLFWPSTTENLEALWNTIITGEPQIQPYPETAEFTIIRTETLSAPANSLTYEIQIPEPFHIEGIHEVKGLDTSPNPTRTYEYKEQDWWEWKGNVPRGGQASITITYHMKLYSTVWDLDEEDSATVSDIPAKYDKYLGTEWKITPDDPQVQALSAQIVGSETNVYNILLKIYKWMDDNLEYQTQRSASPKSCSETLASKSGDCDDQSILLASLARAAGVPVWLNLGIIYDSTRDYWGGHGWNNVFIPMKDETYVIATVDVVNNQFLFRDPYHVSDYIDNGDGDDLQDYYTSWSYSYVGANPNAQSMEDYQIKDLNTEGSVIYRAP